MEKKVWAVKFSPMAEKEWDKLDGSAQKRILNFLAQRLRKGDAPKLFAKLLEGNLRNFWRFRIGDYRLICEFKDQEMIISVVRVAHRREVYRHLHLVSPSS